MSSSEPGPVTTAPAAREGGLDPKDLRKAIAADEIDTIVLALADMDGRLVGKRLDARHFLDSVAGGAAEGCEYVLATDVEMTPSEGYGLGSWDHGFGDFELVPDLDSVRLTDWWPCTALVMADARITDGVPLTVSPRQVLRRQLERLAERGLAANAATELEFIAFNTSYREAWDQGYEGLEPSSPYNVDYALAGTGAIDPLVRRIRFAMQRAGVMVESSKGECNFGQHEINFGYGEALRTADSHAIYKLAAKELADQEGKAITFMAKFDEREGSSCHIHLSLVGDGGANAFAADRGVFEAFLAGQLAAQRELTMLMAPQVNSYKRFVANSFAPTAIAWGTDNRTCALRVVGHGEALRIENRAPGADVNPYLALAAMIAAGLHGLERGLELEAEFVGNAYESEKPRLPESLLEARELFAASEIARAAFGPEVVEHYLNKVGNELAMFGGAVTDWERRRGFERL